MKIKRWTAAVLAAILLFSLLPVSAFAADDCIAADDGMVDDTASAFTWNGTWDTQQIADRFGGTYRCGYPGSSAEIAFEGSGIQFITTKHGGAGEFNVAVDGIPLGKATSYNDAPLTCEPAYSVWGLPQGRHTLQIECIGYLELDGARVLTEDPGKEQAPVIEVQPQDVSVIYGRTAEFCVTAAGSSAFRYQWQKLADGIWTNISGAQEKCCQTEPADEGMNGTKYRCIVINAGTDSAILSVSNPAVLHVSGEKTEALAPIITVQPRNAETRAPFCAAFCTEAQSPDGGSITYQWQKLEGENWTDIPGAEDGCYKTPATADEMDGTHFRCRVINTVGELEPCEIFTDEVILSVIPIGSQKVSLDRKTGLLDIDYEKYLSQHDVVFRSPVTSGPSGSTVGTGRLGAMVWNNGGYKLEITNVDGAPYSSIPSGLVTYRSSPMPEAVPGVFEQRLNLYQGIVTTNYGDGISFTVMGEPKGEALGIHVVDNRENVTEAAVDLSLWLDKLKANHNAPFDSRPAGNTAIAIPEEESWLNPIFTVEDGYAAITRGYEDVNQFGFTIAVTMDGADFTTSLVGEGNDRKLQLNIDPDAKE